MLDSNWDRLDYISLWEIRISNVVTLKKTSKLNWNKFIYLRYEHYCCTPCRRYSDVLLLKIRMKWTGYEATIVSANKEHKKCLRYRFSARQKCEIQFVFALA